MEGQELLGFVFAPEQGGLAVLPVVAFGKTQGEMGSSILSALHLWGEKALWGDGLMGNFLWTDPNTGLMVGECGLFFGSPCGHEQNKPQMLTKRDMRGGRCYVHPWVSHCCPGALVALQAQRLWDHGFWVYMCSHLISMCLCFPFCRMRIMIWKFF